MTLIDLSSWLDELVTKIEPLPEEMHAAATHQVDRIKSRTSQGIGFDNGVFAAYAPSTKKGTVVNLMVTGEMIGAIAVESTPTTARIFFGSTEAEEKAVYQHFGTKHIPSRPFMGCSLSDREEIVADIRGNLLQRINR